MPTLGTCLVMLLVILVSFVIIVVSKVCCVWLRAVMRTATLAPTTIAACCRAQT